MRKILISSDKNYRRYANRLANKILGTVEGRIDVIFAGESPLKNAKIGFYNIQNFPIKEVQHFKSSNWWRWYAIRDILNQDENAEILYLDVDVIIRSTDVIFDLFRDVPYDGFLIALDRVGKQHGKYNTGVFVCRGKEALRVSRELVKLSITDEFIHDQIGFDAVVNHDYVKILESIYNIQLFSKENNPITEWKIIHCIGPIKQWNVFHSQFLKYLLYW